MNFTSTETILKRKISIQNYLPEIGEKAVCKEILDGLRESPKRISSKFFYNEKGSALFEAITELEEYYPTRTEKSILSDLGAKLDLDFSDINIIELGSGDHTKIRLLLKSIPQEQFSGIKYFPVDISQSAIENASKNLVEEFNSLNIRGVVADFTNQLSLIPKAAKRLFCFFGSTIGNLSSEQVKQFMQSIGKEMKVGDNLLLGVDMVKDIEILEKAYNDKKQVTAAFNKNILNAVNWLANSDFNPTEYDHLAFYNEKENCIEMHLRALSDQIVFLNGGDEIIYVKEGELIHTEDSHKFSFKQIHNLGNYAGLLVKKVFTDSKKWFSLVHYVKE